MTVQLKILRGPDRLGLAMGLLSPEFEDSAKISFQVQGSTGQDTYHARIREIKTLDESGSRLEMRGKVARFNQIPSGYGTSHDDKAEPAVIYYELNGTGTITFR